MLNDLKAQAETKFAEAKEQFGDLQETAEAKFTEAKETVMSKVDEFQK
jgi:hypothetical protein